MFISICIPVYKNLDFLKRLLDSINIQSYRDFEVIVSDDSKEDSIGHFCRNYQANFSFRYFKNAKSLGSPENWNGAIRQAKGDWIKLMHDDDWFAGEHSLEGFVRAIREKPAADFLFSAYSNFYFDKDKYQAFRISPRWFKRLLRNPNILFSRNVIGAPSVVIHKRALHLEYDKNIKWLVDIDFYIRAVSPDRTVYIDKPLVNIGIGKEQITQDCFRQRQVEIPEGLYLLNKTGIRQLRNIVVYDGWFRLMRNLEIRSEKDIFEAGYHQEIPLVLKKMIRFQHAVAPALLKIGALSKTLMVICYLLNRPGKSD